MSKTAEALAKLESYIDKSGRLRFRGYKRQHKEMRKVVPKRRFDKQTAHGLIKYYAYHADVPAKELATNAGISEQYVFDMLSYNPKKLKPVFIKSFCATLALTEEQTKEIYQKAAKAAGYLV